MQLSNQVAKYDKLQISQFLKVNSTVSVLCKWQLHNQTIEQIYGSEGLKFNSLKFLTIKVIQPDVHKFDFLTKSLL